MIDITLCHATADRGAAGLLHERLDRACEARVWLEELKPGQTLPDVWDRGLSSAGILLLLSPDAVPAPGRDPWTEVLDHIESHEAPPVATVMARDCRVPPLLRRTNAFTLDNTREIQRWALALHADEAPSFTAAPEELAHLEPLLDADGTRALVSSTVAQEFARQARAYFRQIIWAACGTRSQTGIACEIAQQLGLPEDRVDIPAIERVLAEHRILLVLDGVAGEPFITLREGSRGALIATTPYAPAKVAEPVAEEERALWHALSVCRLDSADIRLAARIAGATAMHVPPGLAAPVDAGGRLYRVVAPCPVDDTTCRAHAAALRDIYGAREPGCASLLAEAEAAYAWARTADWRLASELGENVCRFLQAHHRNAELAGQLQVLLEDARAHSDTRIGDYCLNELSWLGVFPRAPQPAVHATQLTLPLAG